MLPVMPNQERISGVVANSPPYRSRQFLLTDGERRFYRLGLLPAIGDRYDISKKVRLADIISTGESSQSSAFRKIQSKHVDFVLSTPKTTRIIAIVELDDASHQQSHRIKRDEFITAALLAAGIPLIRFPVFHEYKPRIIRHHITEAIK